MTIHIVNYASGRFVQAQRLQNAKWREFHPGADLMIHSFERSSLPRTYWNEEIEMILSNPRGDGLWAWKALCISHVYDQARDGDIVLYMDSGAHPTAEQSKLFSEIGSVGSAFSRVSGFDDQEATRRWLRTLPLYREKGALIEQPDLFLARKWDKRLTAYPEGVEQVCGGFQGYLVCQRNAEFLRQLRFMITRANYDEVSNVQHTNFIEHRHDQTVLTEMVYKHSMNILRTMPNILLHRANC